MEQGKVSVPPIGLTAKYPELGTGPCSADIYWREDLWQKEIDAIFRKSWFMIGRVDQIPEAGDFFSGSVLTMDGSRDNWLGPWPPPHMTDEATGKPLAEERRQT